MVAKKVVKCTDILSKIIATTIDWRVSRVSKTMKHKVRLSHREGQWHASTAVYPMSHVWRMHRLKASGLNYFTVGKVKNGVSQRFDQGSDYYQSWYGCYLITLNNPKGWKNKDFFRLSVADQKNWLKIYGIKNPTVDIKYDSILDLGEDVKFSKKTHTFEGEINSSSDMCQHFRFKKLKLSVIARLLSKTTSISAVELNPPDESFSCKTLTLRGYISVIEVDAQRSIYAVVYANAVLKNTSHGGFESIKENLLESVKNTEVILYED